VLNGADPEPPLANPTSARSNPGTAKLHKAPSRDEVMAKSAADDEQVVALLHKEPMRLKKLAEASGQKQTTLSQRLSRLRERGLVERSDAGAWSAASPP
jgi:predicted transcriptional regulator